MAERLTAAVEDTGGSRSSSKEASINSSSVFLGQKLSSCRIMDQGQGGRAVTRGKGHVLAG